MVLGQICILAFLMENILPITCNPTHLLSAKIEINYVSLAHTMISWVKCFQPSQLKKCLFLLSTRKKSKALVATGVLLSEPDQVFLLAWHMCKHNTEGTTTIHNKKRIYLITEFIDICCIAFMQRKENIGFLSNSKKWTQPIVSFDHGIMHHVFLIPSHCKCETADID